MTRYLSGAALALAVCSPAYASTVVPTTGYALNASGNSLLVLNDVTATGSAQTLNLSGGRLDAITYRPFTEQLYGYSIGGNSGPDTIFTIDLSTGALTDTGASFGDGVRINGTVADFDFNTSLDATRVVSEVGDNLVFFPSDTASGNANAGNVVRTTDLFYDMGDVNEGVDPSIFANAYTNAVDGEISPTTLQYALDSATNSLVTLANNAGTLATVGTVTLNGVELDFDNEGALDIVSSMQDQNQALALLNVTGGPASGTSGLYTIDLMTGEASFFGDLGQDRYIGFAARVAQPVSPIPLPAASVLLLAGLGGLGAVRMRRKS